MTHCVANGGRPDEPAAASDQNAHRSILLIFRLHVMTLSGHVAYGNAILRNSTARRRWDGDEGLRLLDRTRPDGHGGGPGQGDAGPLGAGDDAGGSIKTMRHRAALRVALTALPAGQIKAVFRGAGVAALGDVALVLDGVVHRVLTLQPGASLSRTAVIDLPPHLMFAHPGPAGAARLPPAAAAPLGAGRIVWADPGAAGAAGPGG